MFDVRDKIVLITGAVAGIGASVVKILLEEKIKHVTILDINVEDGLAMQDELNEKHGSNKVKFIKCDVTQEDELVNAFRTVTSEQGYIDVVINNAGRSNDKLFVKQIELNFIALVQGTVQAWNLMRKDNGGRGGTIINVSSVTAFSSFTVIPVYGATKAAVAKFSTTMGDEVHYSRTGVRVLTICFGATNTQLIANENARSFDPVIEQSIFETMSFLNVQTTEQAAQGLTEVYKKGKSGSIWIVTSGKPAVDVTAKYKQGAELFNDIIFN